MRLTLSLGILLCVGYYAYRHAPLPFVAGWWTAQAWDDPLHKRHRIADGLLLAGRLVGRSRTEVVAFLGEPSPTAYFDDWQLVYNLGAERGWLSIDSEWLVMRTAGDGRIVEAAIVRD